MDSVARRDDLLGELDAVNAELDAALKSCLRTSGELHISRQLTPQPPPPESAWLCRSL